MSQKMLARYLVEAVSMETGIPVESIRGRAQHEHVMTARRLVYFATPEVGLSLSEMGRYLNRCHSTICKVIQSHRIAPEDRRIIEAIKLTAHMVARERNQKLCRAINEGIAL